MFFTKRHEEILAILKEKGACSVRLLSTLLFVSEPTIRRDLTVLESENKIKRTFGGAVINTDFNVEVPLILRETQNIRIKEELALEAVKFIMDDAVIFLDASSTVSYIIKHLSKFKNLTVITNSPKNSLRLAELKIRSFSTGGEMLENSFAYVGVSAQDFIGKFNADLFFFSCRGITADGTLNDSSIEETEIRKAMMKNSKKNIFICSSDKLGKKYMYNLCSYTEVDEIISDAAFDFS